MQAAMVIQLPFRGCQMGSEDRRKLEGEVVLVTHKWERYQVEAIIKIDKDKS